MKLSSKNKIDAGFSMASMSDLIFLLLIFFMLTSSFATPSGVRVDLPSSKASAIEVQKISISITRDKKYYINEQPVSKGSLEGELKSRLSGEKGSVIINIDKSVPSEDLIYVVGIANSLEAKVVVATKPQ